MTPTCPNCGSTHLGRVIAAGHVEGGQHVDAVADREGNTRPMTVTNTFQCHDEHGTGCQWSGQVVSTLQWAPEAVSEARAWLAGCEWPDMTPSEIESMPEDRIQAAIREHYGYGDQEFLRDLL